MTTLTERLQTHVRIVAVQTSHPGNIGAIARAMKNMGLRQLYLVNPKQFPHSAATARATGADDLLANAIVTDNIVDALEGCHAVFACSARQRHLSWPVMAPKAAATHTLEQIQQGNQVALVFGNEQSGLDNAIFKHCHYQLHIPSDDNYASLNLAAAVQVVAYEIYDAALLQAGLSASETTVPDSELATAKELDAFFGHLETTLWQIKFLNPAHPKRLMHRLHRLFNRAKLETLEINILRGILTSIKHAITPDK